MHNISGTVINILDILTYCFNAHESFMNWVLLLSSSWLHRCRNWGTEFNNLSKFLKLVTGNRAKIQCSHALMSFPSLLVVSASRPLALVPDFSDECFQKALYSVYSICQNWHITHLRLCELSLKISCDHCTFKFILANLRFNKIFNMFSLISLLKKHYETGLSILIELISV